MKASAAQLVFPAFQFGKHDPALAERLTDLGVGGFCLYRGTPREIRAFTARLQKRARAPLLFAADYEDGLASHVPGGTHFPSNMALGAAGREDLARLKARVTAREARALGVRWIFAPVLDLATRADNPIVNVRSFGEAPRLASRLGRAYGDAMRAEGALACAKHFPGHGDTRKDSHLELPTVPGSAAALRARELAPFAAAAEAAGSVMLAHLMVPALDAKLPVPFSEKIVGGLLRGRMGYRGLVVTDALDMKAVAGRFPEVEAAARALRAGADILLVPADPEALARALPALASRDAELSRRVADSLARLERAKRSCRLFADGGKPAGSLSLVGCSAHRKAARRVAKAALTWAGEPVRLEGTAAYLEPGTRPARWAGAAFVDELRAAGVDVRPYRPGAPGTVVAGAFLSPRAYSGRIALEPGAARELSRVLRGGRPGVLAAFGSPFVLDAVPGWSSALCAFSPCEESQRAAARLLARGLRAPGRMPVSLPARKS
ncbi:MAG TPA: glycoside hydrolase family 3 N-terminal domain-containing protein [Elusimicrobiota bacterium]|jgi:beta-glucosidase-like glycosyl hydrolase|nr:glycoside hydrolase family 3 N-terminal domain-containing protein [Elusimicrobiota bacterium]